jgi:MerR family transcriptional regulator, light-induced transcriptional regulator
MFREFSLDHRLPPTHETPALTAADADALALSTAVPLAAARLAVGGDSTLPIAAVERDTGLSKDTLRIWERRYGFPQPLRDAAGERAYPIEQVDRLRLLKRLLDAGHRPGKVVPLAPAALRELATVLRRNERGESAADARQVEIEACLDLVRRHDVQGLRLMLTQTASRLGLGAFVTQLVAPLNRRIGNAWMAGELEVFEEHVYTESVQSVLRHLLHQIPQPAPADRPRLLLSTLPGESHSIGLLMAEILLALEGCYCVSLGTQTPLSDLVLAAAAHQSDVVGLSFSGALNPNHVVGGLAELRSKLSPKVAVWAGGAAPVLGRRAIDGVRRIQGLTDIAPAVAQWRTQSGAPHLA